MCGCPADASRAEVKGFTVDEAIKQTLRKALYTNTLYRGLREACKVLDARQALFCFLAKNCDQGTSAVCGRAMRACVG